MEILQINWIFYFDINFLVSFFFFFSGCGYAFKYDILQMSVPNHMDYYSGLGSSFQHTMSVTLCLYVVHVSNFFQLSYNKLEGE